MTNLFFSLLEQSDEANLFEAIQEIMIENDTHNLESYDLEYWRWQYKKLPNKKSYVYVAKNESNKILAYYHVPVYTGKLGTGTTMYAMIQDVAVSNTLRGQGVFRRIAEFANADLDAKGVKIVYTFPNTKSIHTFIKYNNFTHLSTFPSYVLNVDASVIVGSKFNFGGLEKVLGVIVNTSLKLFVGGKKNNQNIEKHAIFNQEMINLYKKFEDTYGYGLVRNLDYLNWRYLQKPNQQIHIFSSSNSLQGMTSSVIIKEETIKGIPTLLVMDFGYLPNHEADLLELVKSIVSNSKSYFKKAFGILFITANSPITNKLKKIGGFKLPDKFVPRPLNLLVRSQEKIAGIGQNEKWFASLSDWDVL